MGTIKEYTKKDGTTAYMFQIYQGVDPITGKKRRTTRRGFETEKEANLALSRLIVDIAENGLRTNEYKVDTFKELFELWFEQHCYSIKPTTKERIRFIFDCNVLPDIGHLKLQKITPPVCQKFINKWAVKYAIFAHIKGYVGTVFKYGVLIDVLPDNPMNKIISPRIQKKQRDEMEEFYTKEELIQFFHCLKKLKDDCATTIFRILAFTGGRKGEVLALTWDDIDLDNGTITFNKTLVRVKKELRIQTPKTEQSKRTVSIDQGTIAIIRKWKNIQNEKMLALGIRAEEENNIVFRNSALDSKRNYLYPYYPQKVMDRVCRRFPNMKRIKTHGFRHTHASLLFESGIDVKVVQQRLGHSSIKTTMDVYTHVTPKLEKDVGMQFAQYVNI